MRGDTPFVSVYRSAKKNNLVLLPYRVLFGAGPQGTTGYFTFFSRNLITPMNLTGAHWHLLVNHVPIIGSLLAMLILGYGLIRRNPPIIQLSFGLFVLMSLATAITNQTGEGAEHYLKSINQLNRALLHEHEEAADLANVGMYLTGLLSLLALVWQRAKQLRFLPLLIFGLSLITFGLMANTGRLGGLIMHREIRSETTGTGVPVSPAP